MGEKKNLFGTKIEKGIRYNAQTDSYFVQFNFKDTSRLNCFPTLEDARAYRDKINAEKLAYKINRDTRIIKEQNDKELAAYLKSKVGYPFNVLDTIKIKNVVIDNAVIEDFDSILEERCSEREKRCIIEYYKNGLTLQQIGREYGVTRERVRQILCSGLRKVRYYLLNYNAMQTNRMIREALEKDLLDRHLMREKLLDEYRRTGVISKDLEYEFGPVYEKKTGSMLGIMNCDIDELDLSVRSYNCLRRGGIDTIGELISLTENELFKIRNMGHKCVREIKEKLAAFGLDLAVGGEQE